jgi:hypothetical protein
MMASRISATQTNPNKVFRKKGTLASQGVNYFNGPVLDEKEFRRVLYKKHNISQKIEKFNYRCEHGVLRGCIPKEEKIKQKSEYKTKMKKQYKNLMSSIQPHSGIEMPNVENLLSNLQEVAGSELSSEFVSKIENIVLVVLALYECQSSTQALTIIMMHLKTWYTGSVLLDSIEYFKELINGDDIEPHSSSKKPEWLLQLREAMTNWKLITNNPVFQKISFLISALITMGICSETNFQWNINGIRIFQIAALDKHMSAFDLVDAALETILYFVESGWECFVSKSLTPFLYSDHRMRDFDDEYIFLMQNIEHVQTGNLEKFAEITEQDFDERLSNITIIAKDLVAGARNSFEKKLFNDKLLALSRMRASFDAVRVQGGLRIAPYCVEFFGTSGVGKSSLSAITMVVGLISNGFKATDDYLMTLNEADKYMSNYRSNINGIFIDDMSNTKSAFIEKAPTQKILEIVNNVRQYAVMAEADKKGKVSLSPMWTNITTNVKDMKVGEYSNEPVSILRRANVVVTCKVKKGFEKRSQFSENWMLDPQKVEKYYTVDGLVNIPLIPDIWELDVERVVPVASTDKNTSDSAGHEYVFHNGKQLKDCSFLEFLDFVVMDSKKHFISQKSLVERSKNLAGKFVMCEKCSTITQLCKCKSENNEPHFGFLAGRVVGIATGHIQKRVIKTVSESFSKFEINNLKKLTNLCYSLENEILFNWTSYIPESFMDNEYCRKLLNYAHSEQVIHTIRREMCATLVLCIILVCFLNFFSIPFVGYLLIRICFITRIVKERIYQNILNKRGALPELVKKSRDSVLPAVLAASGVLFTLYTLVKMYKGFRSVDMQFHGELQPKTEEEVKKRDSEVNPWKGADISELPKKEGISLTTTTEQALNVVKKNLFYMSMEGSHKVRFCNAMALNSNILLFPKHMWLDENGKEVTTVKGTLRHKSFCKQVLFSRVNSCDIESTDLSLVYVPQIGDRNQLYRYLPINVAEQGQFAATYIDRDGEFHDFYGNSNRGMVGHALAYFFGGTATYNISTFNGLCMAPLVSKNKGSQLIGFHLGGKTNTQNAVYGTLTQAQYLKALEILMAKPGVVKPIGQGDFKTETYDVQFFQDSTVHPKSPVNYVGTGDDTNYKVFGTVMGKVSPNSSVTSTIISPLVEKYFGIPQKWGQPKLKPAWKPWYESLKYSAAPSIGVEAELLQPAVIDYEKPILDIIRNNDFIRKDVRPLTRMETVCGIDGKRFIDKMPASTSVGYPLTGPKKNYMTLLPPDDFPGFAYPVELDEKFWNEVERIKQCYRDEVRAYPVFKACTKDEPTKLTKDKVRIFQSAPLALQLLTRQYFLPIARVLSIYPLLSECAVGVNCQGPEWHQLNTHMEFFGKDRILAGDYSKYDLRMPAQLTMAAYAIMIDMALASGNYTEDDLIIMSGIAHDICYPMIAFDGTLIEFIGTNPSGQSLTVFVNSIVNSLLMRCAFLHTYPGKDFRENAKMMTYGDDVKGSVSKNADNFNHLSYAAFLKERDIVFTMPDKESTPTKFMHTNDADFLKRKNVWNPDLQIFFGALDEQSIFKSLHSVLKSQYLSPEQQAAINIDGALREWFSHGKSIYEERRQTMQHLCEEAKLVVPGCQVSYEERIQDWIAKYRPSTP